MLFLALPLLLTAACGRGSDPEPVAEPVTINMVSLTDDSTGEQSVLDQYIETNPHVSIERNGYSQFPSAYLLSDTPPDIMGMGPSNILASAIRQDMLMDLTDLWAQAGLLESYPASFKALTEYNGKQYFLPTGYSWVGIYYNIDIFNQLGLEAPQTWDELMSTADTLLANGETPFSIAGQDPVSASLWFDYLNLRLNGPEFHRGLLRGEERYDDPRVRQVFEIWQTLFDNQYFIENAINTGTLDSLTATVRTDDGLLGRNKAVMVLTSPFGLADLPDQFRLELDFFRFPIIDPSQNQGEVVPSVGYMIPTAANNRLAAMDLVAYLSSADAQTMLFQPRGSLPTFVPASSEVSQDNFSQEIQRGMAIVQEADEVTSQYFWSNPSTMQSVIVTTMRTFLRNAERNNVDLDELLLQLEDARQTAITEQAFAN